jgi:hypothetical protein
MLGLNLSINTILIFIIGYVVFLVINNNFSSKSNKLSEESEEEDEDEDEKIEGFESRPSPVGNDLEDKRYKPVLKQIINNKGICEDNSNCLPYNINEIPSEKKYTEPKPGMDNLLGQNFLNAKYHTQINNVGNFKRNKKVDIRPEYINPQVGVNPPTQSIINIDWPNDEQVLLSKQKYSDVWQRLL